MLFLFSFVLFLIDICLHSKFIFFGLVKIYGLFHHVMESEFYVRELVSFADVFFLLDLYSCF